MVAAEIELRSASRPRSRPAFPVVWASESVSLLGSQFSLLAVPLTAALTLGAGPAQMGLVRAAGFAPTLLLALLAGAWVDRTRRRPLLIGTDLGRGLLLLLIPLAAVLGVLRIEYLYLVAFLVGALSIVSDVAFVAVLPALVPSERLVDANGKLELSRWTAQAAGPGLAGAVIQAVGAPLAILADAFSFLASACLLTRINIPEVAPPPRAAGSSLRTEVVEGVRILLTEPLLRALAGCAATGNLFAYAQAAVLVLYVTRDLELPAPVYAAMLTAFGVGGIGGALAAAPVGSRLGPAVTIFAGAGLVAAGDILVALAGPPLPWAPALLVVGQLLTGAGLPLFTVNALSLRQATTPAHHLGRLDATTRFIARGTLPLGALLGGLLGEVIGLRATLLIAATGSGLALLWLLASPLRTHKMTPS